jgi:ABC-2 type transport system permease protein
MRYFRIFLLHFQDAFEYRGRSFVYFLLSFLNPLILLLYWVGVHKSSGLPHGQWDLSAVMSYFLLLMIASAMLISHVEDDVAILEIQEGNLVRWLLKPFSYFWDHLFSELGWRLIQGFFAIVAFGIFTLIFGSLVKITDSPILFMFAIIIMVFGYLLSFLFKMIVAFTAFWLTDFRGFKQIIDVVILVVSGFIMPLEFYPDLLRQVISWLPFPYSIYYPVTAVQGRFSFAELIQIIAIQLLWIALLSIMYQYMWKKGTASFTGVGQ